jgi:predicted CXXCH cytochrome family protein
MLSRRDLVLVCALAGTLAGPALAQDAGDIDASTCASCHGALVKRKNVHVALEAGSCVDCHQPSDSPGKCQSKLAKGWRLKTSEPGLCRECHARSGDTPVHPVIDSMGCTACHDPHGSDQPSLLKAASIPELCGTCHDGISDFPSTHTPVKQGQCLSCHDPHTSAEPHLLKAKPAALCQTCHPTDKMVPLRTKHAPVREGRCLQCHSAHGSKEAKNLVAPAGDLCMKCHDVNATGSKLPQGAMRIDLKKKTVHSAIDAGGCLACHVSTHSSAQPRLLGKRPGELCYDCHDRQDGKAFVHSAVVLGDCAVCHEPHSSDVTPLLRKEKPADTCFLCHADDATGRDFVHKPVADGRCTACHSPHGADDPFSLTRGSGKAACYACHKAVDGKKNVHAPIARGGCTACHDPHASNNPFFLPKPVNQLCQSCHPDKTDGKHVSTFLPSGHKIIGGPDPHRIDRDFSCASCHDPHASDSPKLLRYGEKSMDLCDWCHGDRMGKHPELKDIHLRKRTDKNASDYRAEVPSSLLPSLTGAAGKSAAPQAPAKTNPAPPAAATPTPDASIATAIPHGDAGVVEAGAAASGKDP